MAEKGVLILDQTGGESIACRDAYEQDNDANNRIVQRVDFAGNRCASPMGAAVRSVLVIDTSKNLENLPGGLLSSLIDCGDNTKVSIFPEFLDDGNQTLNVIPIAFDNESSPNALWVYDALVFTCTTATSFKRGIFSKNFVDEPQVINLNGAHKIGLFVDVFTGQTNCGGSQPACLGISLWAFMM